MRRDRRRILMTTFGTQLRPLNTEERLYALTSDAEVFMDTPLPEYKGTKTIFKAGSTVKGTLWEEVAESGRNRKVVMVMEEDKGRFLINTKNLKPTTQIEVEAKKAEEKINKLQDKVDSLLDEAKSEAKQLTNETESVLDKKYAGFTGKQILAATVGVIVLIKLFK